MEQFSRGNKSNTDQFAVNGRPDDDIPAGKLVENQRKSRTCKQVRLKVTERLLCSAFQEGNSCSGQKLGREETIFQAGNYS